VEKEINYHIVRLLEKHIPKMDFTEEKLQVKIKIIFEKTNKNN
jgi:hypothetical protein